MSDKEKLACPVCGSQSLFTIRMPLMYVEADAGLYTPWAFDDVEGEFGSATVYVCANCGTAFTPQASGFHILINVKDFEKLEEVDR